MRRTRNLFSPSNLLLLRLGNRASLVPLYRGLPRHPSRRAHVQSRCSGGVGRFCTRNCPRAISFPSSSRSISTSQICCVRPARTGVPMARTGPVRCGRRKSVEFATPTTAMLPVIPGRRPRPHDCRRTQLSMPTRHRERCRTLADVVHRCRHIPRLASASARQFGALTLSQPGCGSTQCLSLVV